LYLIWGKAGKVFVPTPEDFPQANRPFPQTREVKLNSINLLFPAPVLPKPGFVPAPVRSDVLQLTFRVVKVKPSDAPLKATIVPRNFARTGAISTPKSVLFVSI
jgi:hypothetical protein